MKKILLLLAMSCLLLTNAFMTGCGQEAKETAATSEKIVLEYSPELAEMGFKDPVVLPKRPERVVSLVHTPVLALHEMGVKQIIIPENKMFAWPEDLAKGAKEFNVSMNDNFDIETIIAEQPDLVIVGYQAKDSYGKILEKEKIPVYYVDAGHIVPYKSIKNLTENLIKAFGKDNPGAIAIEQRFAALEKRMEAKRVDNKGKRVMVLQSGPPRHFIQNREGTLGNMADLLGYENVYQDTKAKLVLLDKEQALSYHPDLLLCVGGSPTAEGHQKVMEEDFARNPEYWNSISAIRDGRVVYLPIKYVASAGINVIDNINELIDILEARNL